MPTRREPHITRAMLRAEPDTLWVYGDNLARRGLGGQAAEMRGEPNAVGIPTKRRPARDEAAYFTDDDLPTFREAAAPVFARLAAHLRGRGMVVWPTAGIGTGLADLERRAPRVWASLERARLRLEEVAAHREVIEVEALRLWREHQEGLPRFVQRMTPDDLDYASGAWGRVLVEASDRLAHLAMTPPSG